MCPRLRNWAPVAESARGRLARLGTVSRESEGRRNAVACRASRDAACMRPRSLANSEMSDNRSRPSACSSGGGVVEYGNQKTRDLGPVKDRPRLRSGCHRGEHVLHGGRKGHDGVPKTSNRLKASSTTLISRPRGSRGRSLFDEGRHRLLLSFRHVAADRLII